MSQFELMKLLINTSAVLALSFLVLALGYKLAIRVFDNLLRRLDACIERLDELLDIVKSSHELLENHTDEIIRLQREQIGRLIGIESLLTRLILLQGGDRQDGE